MSGPLHLLAQGQLAIWTGGILAAVSAALQLWHHAIWPVRTSRSARWAALASGLVAAGLRLWVGSGPGDWAEAGRWSWLFAVAPQVDARTGAVPVLLQPLLAAGVPAASIYDRFGPVVSGLCAAATVALAVRAGAAAGAAGAAGLALALWPAHVVFGAGGALTVWGGLGWTMLLLTASDTRLALTWRVWGCAGWSVVLMNSRPEYAVAPLVALLGAWLLQWPRTAVAQLVVTLAVVAPWTSYGVQPQRSSAEPAVLGWHAVGWMPLYLQFAAASTAPVWICVAGLAGLWRVHPKGLGLLMTLLWCGLTAAYALHSGSILAFGAWRYLLSLLPLLLVGAAVGLSSLPRRTQLAGCALLVVSCLPYAPLWLWPTELRAEFGALRATAPALLGIAAVLVVDDDDGDPELGYEHRDRALLALSLAGAGQWSSAAQTSGPSGSAGLPLGWLGERPVYSLASWLRLSVPPAGPTAFWLGLATDRSERAALAGRGANTGVLARSIPVWPAADARGWCQAVEAGSGLGSGRCQLALQWATWSWPAAPRDPRME